MTEARGDEDAPNALLYWNAQDLSNRVWAYGRLRAQASLAPPQVAAVRAVGRAALALGLRLLAPGLSNLLWAHARLAVPCADLSQAICSRQWREIWLLAAGSVQPGLGCHGARRTNGAEPVRCGGRVAAEVRRCRRLRPPAGE